MGQMWTDEMEADLERFQPTADASNAIPPTSIDTDPFLFRDILHGLALYCVAVIRHRAFRGAPSVWSLAEQCDFARWRRRVGEPNTPEIEAWIGSGELDLDETEFRTVTLH